MREVSKRIIYEAPLFLNGVIIGTEYAEVPLLPFNVPSEDKTTIPVKRARYSESNDINVADVPVKIESQVDEDRANNNYTMNQEESLTFTSKAMKPQVNETIKANTPKKQLTTPAQETPKRKQSNLAYQKADGVKDTDKLDITESIKMETASLNQARSPVERLRLCYKTFMEVKKRERELQGQEDLKIKNESYHDFTNLPSHDEKLMSAKEDLSGDYRNQVHLNGRTSEVCKGGGIEIPLRLKKLFCNICGKTVASRKQLCSYLKLKQKRLKRHVCLTCHQRFAPMELSRHKEKCYLTHEEFFYDGCEDDAQGKQEKFRMLACENCVTSCQNQESLNHCDSEV